MKPKELPNETLAAILRAMCSTGICPTENEKSLLMEAADRLEEGYKMIKEDFKKG